MSVREVTITGTLLRARDGTDGQVNVGDRVQLVETERGLRAHDGVAGRGNEKRPWARVADVQHRLVRDRKTGRREEVSLITLRTEE